MDKEQARFILQSFRPDGADATDASFAEALQMAVEDRSLGEWLAGERAADAAFAAALSQVKIPEELRQHILAVMHGEKPDDPEEDVAMDHLFHDALDEVHPPDGLRDQIIAAMEMQQDQPSGEITQMPVNEESRISWGKLAAIAAAVVLGVFSALQMTSGDGEDVRLASHEIQQQAGQILNASFDLDMKNDDPQTINTWLVSHELPAASSIPVNLQQMKSLGCKKIILPGDREASLVCFVAGSEGMIHLIVVKNDDVKDRDLPTLDQVKKKDCYHCRKTNWNVARWQDKKNTFILLAKNDAKHKNRLLQYF
ncbi:MAG: hypothetical protein KJO21_13575 [Verrucomicrobiae bacterium]|nr:hypothetical protein [Verrucomicrobiae bacterium]NNJ44348.1 hypothetical protein [Akkermansiaceae bacterium]